MELRCSIAETFMKSLQAAPENLKVHLCINVNGSSEARANGDAFLRALRKAASKEQAAVTVYPEADAFELARLLSSGRVHACSASSRVALANGANRKLIGN